MKGEMMNKENCRGCRQNFYNGFNDLGVKECWSFHDAKLVWRVPVGHWENPPYKNKKKVRKPSCYHEEGSNRTHWISPDKINKDGYMC